MRTVLSAVLSLALVGLVYPSVSAQSAGRASQSPGAGQMDAANAAKLRTQIHQTMSALSEAQNASQPDEAKIKDLNDRLAALRTQMWADQGQQAAGCPWGAGGRGPCGMGMGPGAGRGRGQGRGMGMGNGRGPHAGPGAGMGRGQGGGCQGCQGQCPKCPLAGG
jgi:hypothetical protein